MRTLSAVILSAWLLPSGAFAASARLATLSIPGTPEFAQIARDVIDARIAIDPSMASGVGLFDDSARMPSFSTAAVRAASARLEKDIAALKAMPWRTWPVDRQIDFRMVYAAAEDGLHQLTVDRLYRHRPASWLEPLSNNLINLMTYAPERVDVREALTAAIPAMVDEMRATAGSPTRRDITTALGIVKGILTGLEAEKPSKARDAAVDSLRRYADALAAVNSAPDFAVVGAESYAWILKRALLLPWTPQQLLESAEQELKIVDGQLAALAPHAESAPAPTPSQLAAAKALTREGLLSLYDQIVRDDLEALRTQGWASVPPELGPIRTRETPDAMVPLIGDGGSMNPPPALGESNVGWWNVEHFRTDWSEDLKKEKVLAAQNHKTSSMGPYAVHEGIPGHHLQLSIARLNPNPLRSVFNDNGLIEGWALYAEEAFWKAGGFGPTVAAHERMLHSWRFRIRRVVYDVNVETGRWTLQQAGDFKSGAEPGKGKVDEDILRTINWPTQLICYFSGKMQIRQLKDDFKKKLGDKYTDRLFHDELLAAGSVPLALIRAKMLGESVPGIE
ncbi:MAG: DUF885 domain-containing protein [Elusimicrobia bacterium]|nr:DUF885 domain-containing protein [Elusimicrobiota bacterium]